MYNQSDLMGATPIFCVEFVWGGRTHRYANQDVRIPTDGTDLHFVPNILEWGYKESIDITSSNLEDNVVTLAMVMDNVDLLYMWSQGQTLEGVEAEFFYVLQKDGQTQQKYDERVTLYRGVLQEPQFGDPLEPDGFVSVSIEAQPYDTTRMMLDSNKYIDTRFPARDKDTADGQVWPIVFGDVGVGLGVSMFSSPAYCIEYAGYSGSDAKFMIAGHKLQSSTCTIQDDLFQSATISIQEGVDSNGNLYSYIAPVPLDGVALPANTVNGTSREWWIRISDSMPNPYRVGSLQYGGDVCRWAINRTGQKVDDGAWANLSTLLNRYKFGGYINDPAVTAWDWLQGNILPWLPISVRMGGNGIKPVLIDLWAMTHVDPVYDLHIGADQEGQQINAVQTERATSDLVNIFTFEWAKRGYDGKYAKQTRVIDITTEDYDIPSEYSVLSINRYGKKPSSGECDYVYDQLTAERIALDVVRSSSLPILSMQITVPTYLGWLQVGDVLSVHHARLYLTGHKMLIQSKEWRGTHWELTLLFETNPIQNK